jgi:hypothetical protein
MDWISWSLGASFGAVLMLFWMIYEQRTAHNDWCRLFDRLYAMFEREFVSRRKDEENKDGEA